MPKHLKEDEKLYYVAGVKYVVHHLWQWKLVENFTPIGTFDNHWYALEKWGDSWWLVAKPGCAWDGATWFPDFDWIMQASLGHDILHWLIAKGVIPEYQNDMIDTEMTHIIDQRAKRPGLMGDQMIALRKFYIERAVNKVDQLAGAPVHPVLCV